ncbi:MAG: SDR family NAD(P)-dependent oxidoreductase [Polyangiaceae bacterium]
MANDLRFDGKVVIVTGAGNGLGRSHALLFGSRGAKVIVNDLGGGHTGGGKSSAAADKVVEEIKAAGGEAVANYDSVEDGDKIVQSALDNFKRIDVVINNAGILRDVSFPKMTQEDWDLIYRVHVLGAFKVTHAAWPHLRDQGYGRVIFTASAAGIYGNFGQTNYAMAKLGVVGMAQTLALEGVKKNIRVNAIAPIAGSRMTETVLPKEILESLKPELVTPLVAYLAHESCEETGSLFEVGGGFFAKLRWERAEGKTFRLGRAVSPEAVKSAFSEITSFEKSTHPANITASMAPIMANVQAGPSKGGNEFIDVDLALGYEMPEQTSKYDERDLAIYALGVGAAHDPLDKGELRYVYEMNSDGFQALPSFGVIPALNVIFKMAKEGKQAPGMNYGFDRILHGEQYMELKRPLPPHATLTHKAKIKNIYDKGRHAIVVTEIVSSDETGEPLIVNEVSTLVRGAGGWGGDRGPSADVNVPPERAPDASVTEKIGDNQALLYRLSGDWNPLHVDPSFATAFGFQKPILHGLCTFGYAARAVLKNFSKGDGRFFKAIRVRFSESVFPGETLVTEMWKENDEKIIFRCKVKERDKVVISNASVELYKEIPVAKPKPKAAAPAATATAASAEPNSADIFGGITKFVAKNPDLAAKIQTSYLFKLSAPESNWVVDLKTGKGSVQQGGDKGDCILELTDSDFLAMCTGKADPQKLYFGGKLRISGNVMASQRLDFLKKVDPNDVMEAMKARGASTGTNVPPGPDVEVDAKSLEPKADDVFAAIADHIARNADLAAKVQNVFQFRLKNPDSVWTVDLKNGKGSVAEGETTPADCTLDLENSDFLDMTSGKADAQKLYFGGKLKISGNVMASQKLTFLKSMDPEAAKAAVAKHRALSSQSGGGAKAATPVATKKINAPAVFEKLAERISKNAALVKEVGAVIGFKITDPESSFSVDLKNGSGAVKKEAAKDAAAIITISDEDLGALTRGAESAQSLYQRGKLRLDGDAHVAARLGFLKDLG